MRDVVMADRHCVGALSTLSRECRESAAPGNLACVCATEGKSPAETINLAR